MTTITVTLHTRYYLLIARVNSNVSNIWVILRSASIHIRTMCNNYNTKIINIAISIMTQSYNSIIYTKISSSHVKKPSPHSPYPWSMNRSSQRLPRSFHRITILPTSILSRRCSSGAIKSPLYIYLLMLHPRTSLYYFKEAKGIQYNIKRLHRSHP